MKAKIEVINPRNGKIDHWITPPTVEELTEKCKHIRTAQTTWLESGLEKRIEAMEAWKQVILAHKDELTKSLVTDTGRLGETVLEINSIASTIERWCKLAPELLTPKPSKKTAIPFIEIQQQLVPYSLVGIISPWNFPLLLSLIDAIPALLAGCGVIIKPSEIAPRFIQPLQKTIAEIPLLKDVLIYIEGAGETGANLIELVDLICFTGSVATGRKVAEKAAKNFIPAFLELGGKDPCIVLESANLELATSAILWGSVVNAGQSCLSLERIYVANSIYEQFVEQIIAKAKRLNINYPSVEKGEIGPIISRKQAEIIQAHLDDAVAKGAIIHCGGKIQNLDGGLWCAPTVLTQVNHQMKIMTEETFGPIMPVMGFSDLNTAINLANDTIYGLSAAIFAGSQTEAISVANKINAGGISINDAGLTAFIYDGEKNSFKYSGLGGSRMGAASLQRFLRKKALFSKTNSTPDGWWY